MEGNNNQLNTIDTNDYEKNDNKKVIIIILLIISFGLVTSGLVIKINSNDGKGEELEHGSNTIIPSSEWKIIFNNIKQETKGDAKFSEDVVISKSKLELSYGLELKTEGDSAIISFNVVNKGTLDAELSKSPDLDVLSDEQKKFLNYKVVYADGTNLRKGDVLMSSESKKIKIYISLKKDIDFSSIINKKIDCSFSLNYVQHD